MEGCAERLVLDACQVAQVNSVVLTWSPLVQVAATIHNDFVTSLRQARGKTGDECLKARETDILKWQTSNPHDPNSHGHRNLRYRFDGNGPLVLRRPAHLQHCRNRLKKHLQAFGERRVPNVHAPEAHHRLKITHCISGP